MSSRASLEALLRYNAQRCESAKRPHCDCACGGKLHGKPHSSSWVKETAERLERERAERDEPARARLTILELDAEFGTDNASELEKLAAFQRALRKAFK